MEELTSLAARMSGLEARVLGSPLPGGQGSRGVSPTNKELRRKLKQTLSREAERKAGKVEASHCDENAATERAAKYLGLERTAAWQYVNGGQRMAADAPPTHRPETDSRIKDVENRLCTVEALLDQQVQGEAALTARVDVLEEADELVVVQPEVWRLSPPGDDHQAEDVAKSNISNDQRRPDTEREEEEAGGAWGTCGGMKSDMDATQAAIGNMYSTLQRLLKTKEKDHKNPVWEATKAVKQQGVRLGSSRAEISAVLQAGRTSSKDPVVEGWSLTSL